MIVTVTLNPAIDRTIILSKLERGALNRVQATETDAGGKGINVSRTVKVLGGETIATGFLGGSTGAKILEKLTEEGIRCDFVKVQGETRTNTKILETVVTELNEPGPIVTPKEIGALMEKLDSYGRAGTLVVLSGSAPRGVSKSIYREITERMHQKGAAVLLDADGELLAEGLKAVPDIVKPNQKELEAYFHIEAEEELKSTTALAARLRAMGIGLVAVSLGEKGAVFMDENECYRCPGLSVEAQSTVGAGDAMVAALACGWERKLGLKETAALGMAVSAGAVMTRGTKPPTKDMIRELLCMIQG